jgi:hypothetical protein
VTHDALLVHMYTHEATLTPGCVYCYPPPVVDYRSEIGGPDGPWAVVEHVRVTR